MSVEAAPFLVFNKWWHEHRVTYRVYGDRKQHRRPMIHRFPVKGGATPADAILENIYDASPVFRALVNRAV